MSSPVNDESLLLSRKRQVLTEKEQSMDFEYCPSCGGDLDTGYECTKCGRDWQSYVHDAALRIETEVEQ